MQKVGSTGYGGQWLNTILPRILIELQQLFFSGPLAGAAANTAIAVPDGITPFDTLKKVLMFNAGVPSDITSTVSIVPLEASGTLTVGSVQPGDSITVGGVTFTFIAGPQTPTSGVAPGQVYIGQNPSITAASLAALLNSADYNLHATSSGNVVTIGALPFGPLAGVAGNSVGLNVTASNGHVTASGTTLTGGSATSAITSTVNTTGNQLLVIWYMSDRNLLQA